MNRRRLSPKFNQPYTELVYQPLLELFAYLCANGLKTFIVSGGGVEFIRVFAEKTYSVPPEQAVGSSIKTKFELLGGKPKIVRLPAIDFIDDGREKPDAKFIGRRPIIAFGNSDGDLQMLQYTIGSPAAHFGLIVHHTDAEREYAYDRKSAVVKLNRALDEADTNGWTVVSMKMIGPRSFRHRRSSKSFGGSPTKYVTFFAAPERPPEGTSRSGAAPERWKCAADRVPWAINGIDQVIYIDCKDDLLAARSPVPSPLLPYSKSISMDRRRKCQRPTRVLERKWLKKNNIQDGISAREV